MTFVCLFSTEELVSWYFRKFTKSFIEKHRKPQSQILGELNTLVSWFINDAKLEMGTQTHVKEKNAFFF